MQTENNFQEILREFWRFFIFQENSGDFSVMATIIIASKQRRNNTVVTAVQRQGTQFIQSPESQCIEICLILLKIGNNQR